MASDVHVLNDSLHNLPLRGKIDLYIRQVGCDIWYRGLFVSPDLFFFAPC